MASVRTHNEKQSQRKGGSPRGRSYRSLLKQYLQAVCLRHSMIDVSERFERAVLAGQVACLLVAVLALTAALWPAFSPLPAEHVVIERWIEEHHPGRIEIRKWNAARPNPNGEGVVVLVRYRYKAPGRKRIETHQWFAVAKDQVVRVDSEL